MKEKNDREFNSEENSRAFDSEDCRHRQSQNKNLPPRTYGSSITSKGIRQNYVDSHELENQRVTKETYKRRKKRRNKLLRKYACLLLLLIIVFVGIYYFMFRNKLYTVAIDAGHGGDDVGAVGIIREIELINPTEKELVHLLEEDGRFRVITSRKEDETISILKRNKKFQRSNPDLVISLHGNASNDSSAYGFECFPAPPGSSNHEESMQLASYVTAEMEALGARLRGDTGIRFGYYVPNNDGTDTHTKLLVDSVDTTIYEYETFGILKNMECPVLLVEQGFITNESDVALLSGEEGTKKAARAYYTAISNYLELEGSK